MITTIEKIKDTKKCEEYCPINSLKTCKKIIETVMKQQLEKHMEQRELLSKYQSSSQRKYPYETYAIYIINIWINKNNKILAIFLEFRRAFDTIDRDILLMKFSKFRNLIFGVLLFIIYIKFMDKMRDCDVCLR